MYSNAIVTHLVDDIENYRRRNYNVDLQIEIALNSGTRYFFTLYDTFQIIDLEFLYIEETENGIPLKYLIRCDSIIEYHFYIEDDTQD